MCFIDEPRACALGYAGVSPLQGSSTFFVVLMGCPEIFVLGISDFIGIFALILSLFI